MKAEVCSYDEQSKCLEVMTETRKRLAVHLQTEDVEGAGTVTSFPARLGYAGTVPKIKGATLEHITLWLDRVGCRAAGYVALSRVRENCDYLIAGPLTPRHFTPAR